jgi:hypothetical protein
MIGDQKGKCDENELNESDSPKEEKDRDRKYFDLS